MERSVLPQMAITARIAVFGAVPAINAATRVAVPAFAQFKYHPFMGLTGT